MALRYRKSIKIASGVKLNVTKRGVGMTVGGKGMHYSVHSSGRRTTSIGIPGTGMSYVSTHGGNRRRVPQSNTAVSVPRPVRPGMFAPKGEKAFYKALQTGSIEQFDAIAKTYPDYRLIALALSGLKKAHNPTATNEALSQLREVFDAHYEPRRDKAVNKYTLTLSMAFMLAPGCAASLPLSRELIAVMLSILYQGKKEYQVAIEVLVGIHAANFATTVVLCEDYILTKRYKEVIELTNDLTNEDEVTMLALVYRAKALSCLGHNEAAITVLKEALRFRSRETELRHMALFVRAQVLIRQNRRAAARKDLEKILAEDADYPNIQRLLEKLT